MAIDAEPSSATRHMPADQPSAVLSNDVLIEMQRRMLRIRLFDHRACELQKTGDIPGPIHTSIGHEAAVVGACMAVGHTDYMTGYHRSHGHPIGKGADTAPLMAELLGRADGICKGKGGSLHLADFSVGSLGESGIVGAGLPIAVGAGLSSMMLGNGRVVLSFFGDGASNAGPFHESLNLASIWKTPTIFFCENNGYAVSFPSSEAMSVEHVSDRADSYSIPGHRVNGQDVLAVYDVTAEAVSHARRGDGPSLVEAKTYRFREHSELLNVRPYREAHEVDEWQQKHDPIILFGEHLVTSGVASRSDLKSLEAEVEAEIEAAVQFAKDSPHPDPTSAFEEIYANPINVRGIWNG